MSSKELIREIIATYVRHGWHLQRVLLTQQSQDNLAGSAEEMFAGIVPQESGFDALWFARASHAGREAWELRLIAAQSYALFEAFEANETEEEREEARIEMENKMREHVAGSAST